MKLEEVNEQLRLEIAERRRAEGQLREERNFISAILETTSALVVVLDRDGRIIRFNRACERMTGYSFAELEDYANVPSSPFSHAALAEGVHQGVRDQRFARGWPVNAG